MESGEHTETVIVQEFLKELQEYEDKLLILPLKLTLDLSTTPSESLPKYIWDPSISHSLLFSPNHHKVCPGGPACSLTSAIIT